MKIMKKLIPAAAAAVFLSSAAAGAVTYVCKIKPDAKGAWIPQTLIIDHDEKTGKVLVYDEIIKTFFDKPLPAKVSLDNRKRITFAWTLPEFKVPNGPTVLRFEFRATFLKKSRKVVMHSHPAGYGDEFTGRGKCRIRQ